MPVLLKWPRKTIPNPISLKLTQREMPSKSFTLHRRRLRDPDEPKIVYRRVSPTESNARSATGHACRRGRLATRAVASNHSFDPWFLCLLILIAALGYLSVRRMEDVGVAVLGLEQRHAADLSFLLQLRLAATKLNNEARARAEADARRELKPPFELRLNAARSELTDLLRLLERPPLDNDPTWQKIRSDLAACVESHRRPPSLLARRVRKIRHRGR